MLSIFNILYSSIFPSLLRRMDSRMDVSAMIFLYFIIHYAKISRLEGFSNGKRHFASASPP